MKKNYILFLLLMLTSYICWSQDTNSGDGDGIESIKVAYITKELDLSPEEAKNFWPVYNNYTNEIKQARAQYPNDELKFEQKVVEIRKKYQGSFQKVLGNNAQRANKVFVSEKSFRDKLRGEQMRRMQQNKKPNMQQQNVPRQLPNKKPGGIKRKPPMFK